MRSAIIAIAALAASVSASSIGNAVIVNQCSEKVYLDFVPSGTSDINGGYTITSTSIESGDSNSTAYVSLAAAADGGWSLKLYTDGNSGSPLQYEYTLTSDDSSQIWYDLSAYNGWGGMPESDWEFSSDFEGCNPTSAYYPVGNSEGTPGASQCCDVEASITLTLCSGSGSSSSSSAVSSAAYSSTAAASTATSSAVPTTTVESTSAVPTTTVESTSAAPTTTAESTTSTSAPANTHTSHHWGNEAVVATSSAATTLVTSAVTSAVTSTASNDVVWVTDVAYVTAYVTAAKRDAHHHQHHARHPHGVRA